MGSGGVSIPQRNWSDEWPDIKKGYKGQIDQYLGFTQKDPLLAAAYPFALDQLNNVGDLTGPLQDILKNLPGAAGYANELDKYSGQLGGLNSYLTGLKGDLGDLRGPLQGQIAGLQNVQRRQINPTLASGGKLNAEQQRIADQAALGLSAGAGMANANAGIAGALLNRDKFRQQRFNTALEQSLGISSGIGGLTGVEGGLIGQQGSLTGLQGNLIGQRAGLTQAKQGVYSNDAMTRLGLTSGIQGINTQALQNTLGTEQAGVKSFSALTNPILAYMSDLFSSNQNASAAESVAGANKSGGAAGGAMGAAGSIISAIIPMLMMSDEDLKTNIEDTGRETPSGIPIKRWQYKGDDKWFEGALAQDVEKVHPEAVGRSSVTGHRFVDLFKTDVPFSLVESPLLAGV